jgi:hypothetical protein
MRERIMLGGCCYVKRQIEHHFEAVSCEFVVKELISANPLIEQRSWRIFPSSGWMTGYLDRTRKSVMPGMVTILLVPVGAVTIGIYRFSLLTKTGHLSHARCGEEKSLLR